MHSNRSLIIAWLVLVAIGVAILFFGDWRFGLGLIISSTIVRIYSAYRTRDRYR